MSEPDAVIFHISDLHFSGYLRNVDGVGELSTVARTHDFRIVQPLAAALRRLLERWHEKAVVVVSGDLTTAAEPPAYETVATFLFGKVWLSKDLTLGLGLQDDYQLGDRVLVVPGNHDAWLRLSGLFRSLTRWRNHLDRLYLFRRYFGSNERPVRLLVVGGVSMAFFLFDSNAVRPTILNFLNLKNALGRGRVGTDQMAHIAAEWQALASGGILSRPQGFDLDAALRIAVLHHHPAIPVATPPSVAQRLLALEDAAEVEKFLRSELQAHMTLCGHQHFPYLYPAHDASTPDAPPPWLSCAGTASQPGNALNSFKLYWVYRTPAPYLEIEEYRREKGSNSFKPQPRIPVRLTHP